MFNNTFSEKDKGPFLMVECIFPNSYAEFLSNSVPQDVTLFISDFLQMYYQPKVMLE